MALRDGCKGAENSGRLKSNWAMIKEIAALIIISAAPMISLASAKEGCIQSWGKGDYKSFSEVQRELQEKFADGKIIRLSLCGSDSNHYFLVTILEASGKVKVVQVPAR